MPPGIPDSRLATIAIPFSSYDPSVVLPGAATVNTCRIIVPFRHTLAAAWITFTDIDNVGAALAASLRQGDAGDAKAGTLVGTALTNAQLAATADVLSVFKIVLTQADKAEAAPNRMYHVQLFGDNASDTMEQPTLFIWVDSIPRGAL